MLRTLLENEMKDRRLSLRSAAREIGIAHTTVAHFLAGEVEPDLPTLEKISKFLGITMNDAIGVKSDDDLPYQITAVLKSVPELEAVFRDAVMDFKAGKLSQGDLKDIVEYATFKLNLHKR